MDFATYKTIYAINDRLKAVENTVNQILAAVKVIQIEEVSIMASAQDIVAKVAEVQGAEDSTIELLDQIHAMLVDVKAQLVQAGVDTAALDGVMVTLDTNKQKLADAVARNPIP